MSDSTADQIEIIRRTVGLSRPAWLRLLNAVSETDLRGEEKLAVARDILRSHGRFVRKISAAVGAEFAKEPTIVDGEAYITTAQVSRALGLGEFHVSALRDRGKLPALRHGRRTLFARDDVIDLIQRGVEPHTQHAPLAPRFAEYYISRQ